jgi:hypothetical protein
VRGPRLVDSNDGYFGTKLVRGFGIDLVEASPATPPPRLTRADTRANSRGPSGGPSRRRITLSAKMREFAAMRSERRGKTAAAAVRRFGCGRFRSHLEGWIARFGTPPEAAGHRACRFPGGWHPSPSEWHRGPVAGDFDPRACISVLRARLRRSIHSPLSNPANAPGVVRVAGPAKPLRTEEVARGNKEVRASEQDQCFERPQEDGAVEGKACRGEDFRCQSSAWQSGASPRQQG